MFADLSDAFSFIISVPSVYNTVDAGLNVTVHVVSFVTLLTVKVLFLIVPVSQLGNCTLLYRLRSTEDSSH